MTTAPDPNPVSLSLPWPTQNVNGTVSGGDLQLTNNGSLVFVSGIQKLQQRIIRRYFTCPAENLPGAGYIPADYIFDPNYGIGATRLIGQPIDDVLAAKLTQKIKAAVLVDEGVDVGQDPIIKLYAAPNGAVWANVTVFLLDATSVYLNFPAR